jgi:hypothetical protein
MRRAGRIAVLALALAAALVAASKTPVRGQQPAVSISRMCSTPQGWCPVPPGYQVGIPCYCLVPPNTQVGGYVVHCPWRPPVDMYLNPHRQCL